LARKKGRVLPGGRETQRSLRMGALSKKKKLERGSHEETHIKREKKRLYEGGERGHAGGVLKYNRTGRVGNCQVVRGLG